MLKTAEQRYEEKRARLLIIVLSILLTVIALIINLVKSKPMNPSINPNAAKKIQEQFDKPMAKYNPDRDMKLIKQAEELGLKQLAEKMKAEIIIPQTL
jgi:hypothetical protein